MTKTLIQPHHRINGIDVDTLRQTVEAVRQNPAKAKTRWAVSTQWLGGTASRTTVTGYEIGGHWVDRNFDILIDEPCEICGSNAAPNPQEYLLASLNACLTVGYVTAAAMSGVELESLRIDIEGNIDARGFLGVSQTVPAGFEELRYTVHIKGDGTPEQMQKIHDVVSATSPNRFTIGQPVAMKSKLIVESWDHQPVPA